VDGRRKRDRSCRLLNSKKKKVDQGKRQKTVRRNKKDGDYVTWGFLPSNHSRTKGRKGGVRERKKPSFAGEKKEAEVLSVLTSCILSRGGSLEGGNLEGVEAPTPQHSSANPAS